MAHERHLACHVIADIWHVMSLPAAWCFSESRPCWTTIASKNNFFIARSTMRSSTESCVTMRKTFTGFCCPIRCARSMACVFGCVYVCVRAGVYVWMCVCVVCVWEREHTRVSIRACLRVHTHCIRNKQIHLILVGFFFDEYKYDP